MKCSDKPVLKDLSKLQSTTCDIFTGTDGTEKEKVFLESSFRILNFLRSNIVLPDFERFPFAKRVEHRHLHSRFTRRKLTQSAAKHSSGVTIYYLGLRAGT